MNAAALARSRARSSTPVGLRAREGRPSDAVVGQVSRYMGWIGRHVARAPEAWVGVVIARTVDLELEYAVRANTRLSLWRFDDALALERVA